MSTISEAHSKKPYSSVLWRNYTACFALEQGDYLAVFYRVHSR